MDEKYKHCDEYIHDHDMPLCLRYFLLVNRMSAMDSNIVAEKHGETVCFADHGGTRVKLTMASRFGDVGITEDLTRESGYAGRVALSELSNFSEEK